MTDATPTPPPAEQPVTPAAATPPEAVTPPAAATPPAAPAYAPAPGVAAPKQTLSLVSFILGIASIVFSAAPLLPIAAGIVAIILSRRGRASEPGAPKWMPQLGFIFGIIGLVLGLLFGFLFYILPIIFVASAGIGGYNNY